MTGDNLNILYEDNHLLVINKQSGQLVQGDQTGRITLLDEGKGWLRDRYQKPGNVFLGPVHRLDRPASGVVVFARTSKAASRLSEEIRESRAKKTYWACVYGQVPEAGDWTDQLERREYSSHVVEPPAGKRARLTYRRLKSASDVSIVEIDLETGRHHQIRVQFSHREHPILGDRRYGSNVPFADDAIALHARQMEIKHPTRDETMCFNAPAPNSWGPYHP
ncbi:MAG: RNA pseudouridine synthase [Gemmatimonadetes bacterium]|nr:RNA pseudouridine synthase [Gemmatimonadota bacterium]